MANTYHPFWAPGQINAEFNGPASLAISIGDLLYWDSANNVVKPFSQLADLGAEALQQADAARKFVGVANTARLSTDTAAGNVRVMIDGIYEFNCESNTFTVGDYVGPSYNVNVLRDQTVDKVAAAHLAIGRVVKRYASATTKVKCRLMSRYLLGMPDRFHSIGSVGQGLDRTATTATGNITLTVDSKPVQVIDPNGANRNVTLPAVAQSHGLLFFITHSGSANTLAVKNPGGTTIGTVGQGQAAIAWCDSTGWSCLVGVGAGFGDLTVDSLTINDGGNVAVGTTTGTKIGTSASQKLGFFNATPVVQPSGASQGALTDNTMGSVDGTLAQVGDTMGSNQGPTINNNFADVASRINAIRTALVDLGLIKGAA